MFKFGKFYKTWLERAINQTVAEDAVVHMVIMGPTQRKVLKRQQNCYVINLLFKNAWICDPSQNFV